MGLQHGNLFLQKLKLSDRGDSPTPNPGLGWQLQALGGREAAQMSSVFQFTVPGTGNCGPTGAVAVVSSPAGGLTCDRGPGDYPSLSAVWLQGRIIWILLDFTISGLNTWHSSQQLPWMDFGRTWGLKSGCVEGTELNVTGISARELNPEMGTDDKSKNWEGARMMAAESAYDVIKLKGHTNQTTGFSLADLTEPLLQI